MTQVPLAQRIARWTSNPKVLGSIPRWDDLFLRLFFNTVQSKFIPSSTQKCVSVVQRLSHLPNTQKVSGSIPDGNSFFLNLKKNPDAQKIVYMRQHVEYTKNDAILFVYVSRICLIRYYIPSSFLSVVVITCASHAQGRRFDPGRKQCFGVTS